MINSGRQAGAAGNADIRPRRLWYWVAGCLLAGAVTCIALAVAGFFGLGQQIHDFQRVQVPGHAIVSFTQPGGYVLYIERSGSCCSFAIGGGSGADGPPFSGWSMRARLAPANGGSPVPIRTWQGPAESYAVAGHQGQTAMYFTITRPGRYYLDAGDVTPGSVTDIAVGRGIGHRVLVPVLLIVAGLVALIAAGLIGVITAVSRHRAGRAVQAPPWTVPPWTVPDRPAPVLQSCTAPRDLASPVPPASRPRLPGQFYRRRKLLLSVGAGLAALAVFVIAAAVGGPGAAPAASSPASHAPRTQAPRSQAPRTQPPAAAGTAPGPRTGRQRWVAGLASLQRHMASAMGGTRSTVVTVASLRSQARRLNRCSAELAGLGPPVQALRPEYQQASRACTGFARGARCDAEAARILNPAGPSSSQAKLTKLFNCSDAGINSGSELLSLAASDASIGG